MDLVLGARRVSVAGGLDFVTARAGWRARAATPGPANLLKKLLSRGATWPTRSVRWAETFVAGAETGCALMHCEKFIMYGTVAFALEMKTLSWQSFENDWYVVL